MSIPSQLQLTSCNIIERNSTNKELIWSWSYPSINQQNRVAYTRKIKILAGDFYNFKFSFFHHVDQWVYVHSFKHNKKSTKVDINVIIITALDYNPERYEAICKTLERSYTRDNSPIPLLETFLSIIVNGKSVSGGPTNDDDTFYFKYFENTDFFKHPELKGIIETFGLETILIYTALLLKKRILIYHHDISSLGKFVLSLPAFLPHRNMWNALYPFVETTDVELSAFKDSKFHVLGCTDGNIFNRIDLYDLFVNVPAGEISVAPLARESMTMTKTHKDIALFMVQLTEKKGFTERDIMQEITRKTKELIENLRTLGKVVDGRNTLSLNSLKEKEFSTTLETFLCALAQAENFVIVQ